MAKNFSTDYIRGPLMRVSYAWQLFSPQEQKNDDGTVTLKHGCTLIAPVSADWSGIEGIIAAAVRGQWAEKGVEKFKAGLIKNPILKGDGKEARSKDSGELHAGMGPDVRFIRVTTGADRSGNPRKPRVYAPDAVRLLEEQDDFPSGSWGYPILNAWTWSNPKNGDGVSLGLDSIQLVKKAEGDEILGGAGRRADPSKFFEAVKDDGTPAPKGADASSMFG